MGCALPGFEKDAGTVGAELDTQNGLHDDITDGVMSVVVALTGEVNSPGRRGS